MYGRVIVIIKQLSLLSAVGRWGWVRDLIRKNIEILMLGRVGKHIEINNEKYSVLLICFL